MLMKHHGIALLPSLEPLMSPHSIWDVFRSPSHSKEALEDLLTWQSPLALESSHPPSPTPGLFLSSHFAWLTPSPLPSFLSTSLVSFMILGSFQSLQWFVCLLELCLFLPPNRCVMLWGQEATVPNSLPGMRIVSRYQFPTCSPLLCTPFGSQRKSARDMLAFSEPKLCLSLPTPF